MVCRKGIVMERLFALPSNTVRTYAAKLADINFNQGAEFYRCVKTVHGIWTWPTQVSELHERAETTQNQDLATFLRNFCACVKPMEGL